MYLFDNVVIVFDGSFIAGLAALLSFMLYARGEYIKYGEQKLHKERILKIVNHRRIFIQTEIALRMKIMRDFVITGLLNRDDEGAKIMGQLKGDQLIEFVKTEYDDINKLLISVDEEPILINAADLDDRVYGDDEWDENETLIDDNEKS